MLREPVSADPLAALGAALGPVRTVAREGADEVLSHFPEVGDRETQAAVDGFLDLVADLLREVEASATDLAESLRVAGVRSSAPRSTEEGSVVVTRGNR